MRLPTAWPVTLDAVVSVGFLALVVVFVLFKLLLGKWLGGPETG